MRQQHDALNERHAQVLAISVDPVEESKRFREKLGAEFPFLSDPGQSVARHYTGSPEGGMDRPSVFIVDRRGHVAWRYFGTVSDRAPASEVIKQLDRLEQAEKKRGKSEDPEPCPKLEESKDG